ncbi:MAG: hypothetical protein JO053_00750 [Acidobacteria bacterium]|nr:hypothetical protein [Acidobacteriota bacterium]
MIKNFAFGLSIVVLASAASAQDSRVVVTSNIPPMRVITQATPAPTPPPVIIQQPSRSVPVTGTPAAPSQASNLNYKGLSFKDLKAKIAEAKRELQTKPVTTALVDPTVPSTLVRIAYYDPKEKKIDYITVTKDAFLTPAVQTAALSSGGRPMTTMTVRANGVNTPVVILNEKGEPQLPLIIQYPVERNGKYVEAAYYISTHPGIITPEVVGAGRLYVRNVIDIARENLRAKGYPIQPKVADIAEHLAAVEHVDQTRFRTEPHANIFNDVYTLYALNEGQTFRYSVSTAGAGGMVQMIPSTYRMVREHFPNAGLMPDFVEGMRNHVNASEAMLLYMQMTWNDLLASPTVSAAFSNGTATQDQLMAVGYNSNPAKISGYINRAGSNWTGLIPNETKMYLQVYSALDADVRIIPRDK